MKKLVRDFVPEALKAEGKEIKTHIAEDKEYEKLLHAKLKEEVDEFLKEENEEELADVLEVIDAISAYHKFDRNKVRAIKEMKAREKGRFRQRIVIDKVK